MYIIYRKINISEHTDIIVRIVLNTFHQSRSYTTLHVLSLSALFCALDTNAGWEQVFYYVYSYNANTSIKIDFLFLHLTPKC